MKKTLAVVFALFIFLSSAAPSLAQEHKEPSAGSILFDVVLVRPLGVVSIFFGTGVFVAALPFSVPTRTVGMAGKKLIKEPFLFTFGRPVGDLKEY